MAYSHKIYIRQLGEEDTFKYESGLENWRNVLQSTALNSVRGSMPTGNRTIKN